MFTDLYHIETIEFGENGLSAKVTLNAQHAIFAGHFPGQPVLPGVCQLALMKDLLQRRFEKPLRMHAADQVKFMAMVDPRRTPELDVDIRWTETEDGFSAQALILQGDVVFLKSKARFSDV